MKMLWLSAVTATCLLFGSMAHAGDHHHGRGDRHERHYDNWHPRHDWRPREVYYRPVHYHPAPVYYAPVRYRRPVPVVPVAYEPIPVYRGNGVHGSITVGF